MSNKRLSVLMQMLRRLIKEWGQIEIELLVGDIQLESSQSSPRFR